MRMSPTNNGFFGFRLTKDIFEYLRKQWAGLMFEYLQSRSLSRQLSSTNETLASLSAASNKIEEIVRNIYQNVDAAGAAASLTAIDLDSRAKELFLTIAARTGDKQFLYVHAIDENRGNPPVNWVDYLCQYGFFDVKELKEDDGTGSLVLRYDIVDQRIAKIAGKLNKLEQAELSYFSEGYEAFLKLSREAQTKLARDFVFTPPPKSEKKGSAAAGPQGAA